jgi:excisionase family DNA binding protein
MPFTQPRHFLTAPEAARLLGGRASGRTVARLILKGELKGKKVGHGWRILPEWLEEYMSRPDEIRKE